MNDRRVNGSQQMASTQTILNTTLRRSFAWLSRDIHVAEPIIGVGATMTSLLRQRRASTENLLGMAYAAGFLLVWLFCWPLYRLVRTHLLRG